MDRTNRLHIKTANILYHFKLLLMKIVGDSLKRPNNKIKEQRFDRFILKEACNAYM